MSINLDLLVKRIAAAQENRARWEPQWQDCYDYAMPNRTGFRDDQNGTNNMDKVFDSTPVTATQEYASRMQAGLTPVFVKWFNFEAGSEVPKEQRSDVNRKLEDVGNYVTEILQASNLDQEINEGYMDLAVGTSTLLVEEGDAQNPIKFTTLPQPQVYIMAGPYGGADKTYRRRDMTVADILLLWPKANISAKMMSESVKDPDEVFTIWECLWRDWEHKATELNKFCLITTDPKHIMLEGEFKGDGSNPMISYRWSKAAGEVYGRGPLFNTMGDVKTLNAVVEMTLENAHMAIVGMWQSDDDAILNPDTINLVPGTVIPRPPQSTGLEPLGAPGDFNVSNLLVQDMRHNIRKALFNESLGRPEGTPMSATEVHERMADLARTIGSAYGRMHNELVSPLLRRVVYILKKQGRIDIPLVNGREVKIVNVSPLAQAQHNEDVARVGRWLDMSNQAYGPQTTAMVSKPEEVMAYTGQKIGVPDKLMRNEIERQELVKALSETQDTPTNPTQG